MKTNPLVVAIAVTLAPVCPAAAQSSFRLANIDPPSVDAPVFDAQGVPLAGSNYLAELWGAATPESLSPLVALDRENARVITPFITDGYFVSTLTAYLSVPTVPPRGWAWLQVRAWDARLGGTYEQVLASGLGGYGESPLFYAQGGDPYDILGLPAPLIGLESFSLLPVVPEPASGLLLLLGLPVVFFIRRFCSLASTRAPLERSHHPIPCARN